MTLPEIFAAVNALGVTLLPGEGGKIRVRPAGALPQDLREAIVARRDEILSQLSASLPRSAALELLADAVRREYDGIDAWASRLRERGMADDLAGWLRENAPDLAERIRLAEGEANLATAAADVEELRRALARWSLRWRTARRLFEESLRSRRREAE